MANHVRSMGQVTVDFVAWWGIEVATYLASPQPACVSIQAKRAFSGSIWSRCDREFGYWPSRLIFFDRCLQRDMCGFVPGI